MATHASTTNFTIRFNTSTFFSHTLTHNLSAQEMDHHSSPTAAAAEREIHELPGSSPQEERTASRGSSTTRYVGEPISDTSDIEEAEGGTAKPRRFELPKEEEQLQQRALLNEDDEDDELREFEEQEREVSRQLKESLNLSEAANHSPPPPSSHASSNNHLRPPTPPTEDGDATIFVPDSVHNRQSSLADIHQESLQVEDSESEYYPGGFPAFPPRPPPAYDSSAPPSPPPPAPRAAEMEEEQQPPIENQNQKEEDEISSGGYPVPSPGAFYGGRKISLAALPIGSGGGGGVTRNAIVDSFALAGGMAAAVAGSGSGSGPVSLINPPPHPDNDRSSSTASSVKEYLDNIRDQPEQEPEPPVKQEEEEEQIVHYQLTDELQQLFALIDEYHPEKIEIDTLLRPFLLDYIPAVGDVDPFIKIPRIDDTEDLLGLTVLDEPATIQSDTAMVNLKLRQQSKSTTSSSAAEEPVKKISRVDRNAHEIDKWIASVKEVRRTRPPDRVHYSRPMPDIDRLMQEWTPEMEQALRGVKLPTAKLDVPLEDYVDLCLALADVPMHKSRIQSLHLLFSLYREFKESQHFRNLEANTFYDSGASGGMIGDVPIMQKRTENNRLEL